MADDNGLSWRSLNREGCELGRLLQPRIEALESDVSGIKRKIDRLTWALVTAAIGFGTAAVMLALNLLMA